MGGRECRKLNFPVNPHLFDPALLPAFMEIARDNVIGKGGDSPYSYMFSTIFEFINIQGVFVIVLLFSFSLCVVALHRCRLNLFILSQ